MFEIAQSKGANVMITHEGAHYSYHDSFQSDLLNQNKVWRN